MGTSRSWAELQAKLDRAVRNLEQSTPATVRAAAEAAQGKLNDAIKDRVPDFDMSGLSSQRTKSGKARSGKVGMKIVRPKGYNVPALSVRAAGPVHWLEAGTRAHLTGVGRLTAGGQAKLTKKGKYRKGQQRRMNYPRGEDGWRTGPFRHPGTAAGHTWSKGIRAAVPVAGEAFKRRAVRDVAEPFL